jgi:hypothetical protein
VLISGLTTSLFSGLQDNPDVPARLTTTASVELSAGVPFLSDKALVEALDEAGVSAATTAAVVEENEASRIDGLRAALAVLALLALAALFSAGSLPRRQPGAEEPDIIARRAPGPQAPTRS